MVAARTKSSIYFHDSEYRILAAFGDIIGSQSWIRRSGSTQIKRTFSLIHAEWEKFAKSATTHKAMGDGFLSVWELGNTNGPLILDILDTAIQTTRNIYEIINELTPVPRPSGWRIRFVSADSLKWSQQDGKRISHDYLSQGINLAKELLYVQKEHAIVLHESAYELIPDKDRDRFIFNSISHKTNSNLNIIKEDLQNLRSLQWNKEDK
jgi:hypothetical protein